MPGPAVHNATPRSPNPEPLFSAKRWKRLLAGSPTNKPSLRPRERLQLFPLRGWLARYDGRQLRADAQAGLNVALLDFPQGLAYAMIAGLPFQMGIYASAMAAILGACLASSRHLMLGPTNAIAVLCVSAMMSLRYDQEASVAAMPALLVLTGLFLLIGAVLRVAAIINYISRTVITGYITAAALLIIVNQIKNILGVDVPNAATFFNLITNTIGEAGSTHLPSLFLAIGTGVLYLALKRLRPGWPNVAITLGIATLVCHLATPLAGGIAPISQTSMEAGSWPWQWPVLTFEAVWQLSGPALALAFLSLLESASIAKTLAARSGDRVDINQQMLSMGVANLGCAVASGMPISGSLTRSVLNWSSGGKTPFASIISGSILVVGMLALGPLISGVPKPALAVLVILVGVSLLNGKNIRIALGTTGGDALVFCITLAAGLLFPLDQAIYLGAAASIFVFLRRAGFPEMVQYAFTCEGQEVESTEERPALTLLHVEGDLFFGSSDIFLDQTCRMCTDPNLRAVILRLRNAHNVDASCAMAMGELVKFARDNKREVILCGVRPEVMDILRDSGLLLQLGAENVFADSPENPTLTTSLALKRAQKLIGGMADVRLLVESRQQDVRKAEPADGAA